MGNCFGEFLALAQQGLIPYPPYAEMREVRTMPLYDYECECGHAFEAINSIDKCGEPLPCPQCDRPAQKVIKESPGMFRKVTKGAPLGYMGNKAFQDEKGRPQKMEKVFPLHGSKKPSTKSTD